MSRNNISTPFGYHEIAGVIEITATVSGLVKGTAVVVGKMPRDATIDDIIGVHFQTEHGEVQSIGGKISGAGKYFVCNGMSPVDNDLIILESVDVRLGLDGDNITFTIVDWHGFTNKGVAYATIEDGEAVFDDYDKAVKIYIK